MKRCTACGCVVLLCVLYVCFCELFCLCGLFVIHCMMMYGLRLCVCSCVCLFFALNVFVCYVWFHCVMLCGLCYCVCVFS